MKRKTVSLCLIARDEEATIGAESKAVWPGNLRILDHDSDASVRAPVFDGVILDG